MTTIQQAFLVDRRQDVPYTLDVVAVEEEFLAPAFGRTSLDERDDQNGFDGEDTLTADF